MAGYTSMNVIIVVVLKECRMDQNECLQCECMISTYHPMVMGGPTTRSVRCENKATILVFGKTEEEKKFPPMTVCDRCYKEFAKLNPDYEIKKLRVDT
jgi:hypothetical protein